MLGSRELLAICAAVPLLRPCTLFSRRRPCASYPETDRGFCDRLIDRRRCVAKNVFTSLLTDCVMTRPDTYRLVGTIVRKSGL